MSNYEQHIDLGNLSPSMAAVFAAVVASTVDAIIAKNTEGIIIGWNAGAEDLFGYSENEIIGQDVNVLIPADRTDEEARIIQRVIGGERIANYETERLRKDGSLVSVSLSISPLRDSSGRMFGASKIVRDISELAAARVHQRRLASIVEHSDDAILSKDLDGVITSWNPAAERIYGYAAEEILGHPVSELIPPAQHGEELRLIERVVAGERVEQFETRRVRKDGVVLDMSLTVSPLVDVRGKVIGASVIGRDVTDRRRLIHLDHENAQLTRADHAKSNLLAMASHEMRTPLTAISGFAATLIEHADSLTDGQRHDFLEIIDAQANRMSRLVEDLLTLSSIEAGGVRSNPRRITLLGPIEQTVRELAMDVEVDCPADLEATADESLVQQILVNYLANARKYGSAPISISARDGDGTVEIRVSDVGPGVDAEFEPHLFERFAQAPRSSDGLPGTGLGLSIVRGLAQVQGGQAWYEPNEPSGACFCVRLPGA